MFSVGEARNLWLREAARPVPLLYLPTRANSLTASFEDGAPDLPGPLVRAIASRTTAVVTRE